MKAVREWAQRGKRAIAVRGKGRGERAGGEGQGEEKLKHQGRPLQFGVQWAQRGKKAIAGQGGKGQGEGQRGRAGGRAGGKGSPTEKWD